MKKISYILIICLLFVGTSTSVFALNSPVVNSNHGVITALLVDNDFSFGGEFGVTDNVAFFINFCDSLDRMGIKYEVNPNLAVVGGYCDSPFIGVNAAQKLADKLLGMAEIDLTLEDNDLTLYYDFGVKYNLGNNLDLRGGVVGRGNGANLQLGFGYGF